MKNKNALVFGATGGIGSSICKALKQEGVRLYLILRSKSKAIKLANEFGLDPAQYIVVKSITDEKEYKKVAKWSKELNVEFRFGIHCAGQGVTKKASKISLKEWNETIDINLTSAFAFYQVFQKIKEIENYELVYFSSASLNQIWPKNSLYGASKAGLEVFAQTLQKEIRQEGGRVWLYRPGSVNTGFFSRIKNHLPVEKMLTPDELSQVVIRNLKTDPKIYYPIIPILSD